MFTVAVTIPVVVSCESELFVEFVVSKIVRTVRNRCINCCAVCVGDGSCIFSICFNCVACCIIPCLAGLIKILFYKPRRAEIVRNIEIRLCDGVSSNKKDGIFVKSFDTNFVPGNRGKRLRNIQIICSV